MNAPEISRRLPSFKPYKEVSVGEHVLTLRSGEKKFATTTVWQAALHEGDLHGNVVDVNDFLARQIPNLLNYKDVFWELRKDGEVSLEIHLKLMDSYHTAFVIEPDIIKGLSELGITLDIEVSYFPAK
jgi:hypothetical protein